MKITTAQWRQHVDTWRDSGLSQAAYCREHELNNKSFSLWTRKQAPAGNTAAALGLPAAGATIGMDKPGPTPVDHGPAAGLPVAVAVAAIKKPEFIPVSIKTPSVSVPAPAELADTGSQRQSAADNTRKSAVAITLRLPGAELALSTAVPPGWLAELLRCLA